MKHVSRVALSLLAFVFFVSAMGILPASARAKKAGQGQGQQPSQQQPAQDPAATQTVSGKVASVDKASFTLTVASATNQAKQQVSNEAAAPKSMTFQVDKNTTIDGQLKVGANADVTYRQDQGSNIAISVHVGS
jgi:hypothetical protein